MQRKYWEVARAIENGIAEAHVSDCLNSEEISVLNPMVTLSVYFSGRKWVCDLDGNDDCQ